MVDAIFTLSDTEEKVFNNVSREKDPTIYLGERIQDTLSYLQNVVKFGTPVNGAFANKTLAIDGVVVHGEAVSINNPEVAGADIYEFLATEAQVPTVPVYIPVDIEAYTTKAHGTLTMDTQPTSGNTVTIGTKVFTFVPVGTDTADGEVSIGADLAAAKVNLVAAINGTDGISDPHPYVSAGDFVVHDCVITALVGGVAGNALATTETFSAGTNVFASATLGSGTDCSAANAVTALVAAITAADTQHVGAADGAGNTVVLTADDAGAAGNDILISETLANGSFAGAATTLSGGVDGTVSDRVQVMIDGTYLYVCVAPNGVDGTNWRRVTLGSAY